VAGELGYQPNAIAQGLVKKETRTIGLLIPDITNPFFPEVARGIEDAANEIGYTILLCNTNWSEAREEKYLNVLFQKKVDGIIIAPSSEKLDHLQKNLKSWLGKAVFISQVDYSNSTSILIDNFRGAQMAVEHLIVRGHTRIVFLGGMKDISSNQERFMGYRRALENNHLGIHENYILNGNFKRETGYSMMKKILENNPKPDGVFAANDLLALGAIQAIKEAGMRIPIDMAVVGFDDIEFASLPEISLTTVAQPKYDMGKIALQSLVERIKGGDTGVHKRILLEPELIVRQTS
jgi:LacI family transcriptional regulator